MIRAVKTWAALTLSGVVVVSTLILWLLIRRGRLIRAGSGEAKAKPEVRHPLDI